MALLVDGENYFAAVRSAMGAAQYRIVILGWYIQSLPTSHWTPMSITIPYGDIASINRRRNPRDRAAIKRFVATTGGASDTGNIFDDLKSRIALREVPKKPRSPESVQFTRMGLCVRT
jgi:hypothetical protein